MPANSLGLLSRLWLREPDADAVEALKALTPSPRVRGEGRGEGRAPREAADPAELAAAYAELFLLNVYPYGTVFTEASGELGGPAAEWTARRYEESGFRPPELLEVGAPDHVGLGLAFLDHLGARGEKDDEFSSYLAEWVPICCLAVEREPAAHPFYKSLAALTRDFSLSSRAERGTPGLSAPNAESESDEDEVGLSHVVRFLLAPARSGLFLSRAKLGSLAQAAGMRLPFGSRFDVAHLFFQTAGESGKVEAVLDLLGEEVVAWESAYQVWADECPRWAPAAARWLARTAETRRRLAEMQQLLENPPELEYVDEPR